MARIKYIAPSPKAGRIDHVYPHIADTLVSAGLAEHIVYKDFRERLAAEFSPPAVAPVVEWGVQDKTQSPFSSVLIIKRTGCETQWLKEPPVDCPPSIVARWAELTNAENPELVSERLQQLKNQQITQQSEDKKSTWAALWSGK